MHDILRHAEAVLRRHAAPALRLGELLARVRTGTNDRTLSAAKLRTLIEEHPDHFRILDPWKGPWRAAGFGASRNEETYDPWVVVVTDPGDQDLSPPRVAARLRESVRWMARGVDPRSSRETVRWHVLAVAESDAREALRRRAA